MPESIVFLTFDRWRHRAVDHWIDSPEVAASQEELIGLRSPVDTRPR